QRRHPAAAAMRCPGNVARVRPATHCSGLVRPARTTARQTQSGTADGTAFFAVQTARAGAAPGADSVGRQVPPGH
ncbi:hypothetical protein ABTE75_20630, partial [Acinetobacter baumannii]